MLPSAELPLISLYLLSSVFLSKSLMEVPHDFFLFKIDLYLSCFGHNTLLMQDRAKKPQTMLVFLMAYVSVDNIYFLLLCMLTPCMFIKHRTTHIENFSSFLSLFWAIFDHHIFVRKLWLEPPFFVYKTNMLTIAPDHRPMETFS